ncbi:MAG: hypothetical protein ACREJP_01395 [Candidatus Methylomirabilales bacterium]
MSFNIDVHRRDRGTLHRRRPLADRYNFSHASNGFDDLEIVLDT